VAAHGLVHALPVRGGHLPARAGLGLHAGRRERGSDGLDIGHRSGELCHLASALEQGDADVVVARADGVSRDGQPSRPRRLAHVHASPRRVGRVGVAAGLHHLAVAAERAVAHEPAVQGGERRREVVLDLHGECAFCGCAALGMGGV
jgi:hypothetical protein